MLNLVAVTHQLTTSLSKVLHMFANQVLCRYENVASVFIWLFEMLECCSLHFNRKIVKGPVKLIKQVKIAHSFLQSV